MKLKNIIYVAALAFMPLAFTACSDDDDDPVVHTDASALVNGTYTGSIFDVNGNEKANDIIVIVNKIDKENVQAVDVVVKSTALKMNIEAPYNVSKAGDNRYLFAAGDAGSLKYRYCGGELNGDDLTFYLTLSSKYAYNATASAKVYTLKCKKQ